MTCTTIKHLTSSTSEVTARRYQQFDYNCKFWGLHSTYSLGVYISKLRTARYYSYLLSALAYVGPRDTLETITHSVTQRFINSLIPCV